MSIDEIIKRFCRRLARDRRHLTDLQAIEAGPCDPKSRKAIRKEIASLELRLHDSHVVVTNLKASRKRLMKASQLIDDAASYVESTTEFATADDEDKQLAIRLREF